jgi:ParB family chromosome partitioning protein
MMEKRKALGKGLQALIPEVKADTNTLLPEEKREEIIQLKVSEIKPGRFQPRTAFKKERQQELAASIREKGVVQPVLVRKGESGYELIAGERRLRAVKTLGVEKIPAIVKQVDNASAMELALIENLQRENLNPIEEAKAYERLAREFNLTQEKIAQSVGKDRTSITNTLRLLNLPQKIQQFLFDDMISMGHARALLSVSDEKKQSKLCEKIIRKGLSVREAENLVKPAGAKRKTSAYRTTDPNTLAVEEQLQQALGTRVQIFHGKKRGRIVIDYFSTRDLERVTNIITNK